MLNKEPLYEARWLHIPVRRPQDLVNLLSLSLCLWNWYTLGPMWAMAMRPRADQVVDFYQEWGSARNFWRDVPIYTPHSITIPRYLGLAANPVSAIEYNIHPPVSVLLVLPLGLLNYPDAVFVWNIISLLAFLVSVLIVAVLLDAPRSLILPSIALLPVCHPLYGNIYQGQLNLLLTLLITVIWALERKHHSNIAGFCLAVAASIKLFPIYLLIYYAARGRIRPLLIAVTAFITINFLAMLVLGIDTYKDYIEIVIPWNAEFRLLGYNLSIAGLWHKLFYPVPAERIVPLWSSLVVARWGTVLSNLIVTLVVARVVNQAHSVSQTDFAFAATTTAMLLVSPITWDTALPILLVTFALMAHIAVINEWHWLMAALALILVINSTALQILTLISQLGHVTDNYSWVFMLGFPSLKFYALVVTLTLSLVLLKTMAVSPNEYSNNLMI